MGKRVIFNDKTSVEQRSFGFISNYYIIIYNNFCFAAATGMDSCEMTFLSVGNDRLPDSALTASTSFTASHGPERGRLNTTHGESYLTHPGGWSAADHVTGDHHWIQVQSYNTLFEPLREKTNNLGFEQV